jgi:hypothetical protein
MDLQNLNIMTRYNNPVYSPPAPKFNKGKLVPVHAMKASRKSTGILLNFGSRLK